MRNLIYFTFLFFATLSCSQNIKKGDNESIEKTIQNVIDISRDTIIACKYGEGLIISLNAGKKWAEVKTDLLFDEITITDSGFLVGIDSWRGIHEPDYSRLYLSKDFGQSWKIFTLKTERFFPVQFISNPKEPVLVQTVDNKIYRLDGTDLVNDWIFVKKDSFQQNQQEERGLPYKIDEYDNFAIKLLLETNNNSKVIAELTKCRQVNSIEISTDFVYITGAGYEKSFEDTYAYFASYSKKNGLKEFKIPGHYAYLKKTYLGNIYIMNDDGLFITNEDTLRRLY